MRHKIYLPTLVASIMLLSIGFFAGVVIGEVYSDEK